jgi:predicted nucleotidyltransferase
MDLISLFQGKLSARPGLVSAYLFGSEAEGRTHRESDVVVGVLLARSAFPAAKDRFEERLRLIADLEHGLKGREVDMKKIKLAALAAGRSSARQSST